MYSAFFTLITIFNFCLAQNVELPRNDLIILESGEKIPGHITEIYDGMIKIKTGAGEKTVIREVSVDSPRDIVEAGILKSRRYAGTVTYLGDEILDIKTSSGDFEIKRGQVRKIIISHESLLPPLDL